MTADRKRILMAAGALALAGGIAWGGYWWTAGRLWIGTDDAYVRADVVTIAPRVAGNLVAVMVADNQMVHAGDILARIDDRDYRARLDEAQGALAAARADFAAAEAAIARIDAETRRQASLIAEKTAALSARTAEARQAGQALARQATLARADIASAQDIELAEATAHKAGAGVAEAHAAMSASRADLPVLSGERRVALANRDKAQGAILQARARIDAAQADLSRTVLRAPVSGRVGQRALRLGQYAETGTPLLAIVPVEAYVVANYKETQVARLRPGQPVSVSVDALGTVLHGHVDSLAPASGAQFALLPPDNATGNFTKIVQRIPVRIRIDPGQTADLRPGMSVETSVDTRR
jgi:membrane fusion protein, multidrug efflux system